MQDRHSQALEELFGIRRSIEAMRSNAAPTASFSRIDGEASPGEAVHQPEIFSELCR